MRTCYADITASRHVCTMKQVYDKKKHILNLQRVKIFEHIPRRQTFILYYCRGVSPAG